MFFKNLIFQRLPGGWADAAADLESRLAARPLRPCGPFDMSSKGWVPVTSGGRLLHTVNGHHLVALGSDDKLLPGSIVRQIAQERAEGLAAEQGFPVGRRQLRELRARVADELRARALTRRRVTRAWLDPRGGWFAVDASSPARAELVIETLSDTLGSFAPTAIETSRSPQAAMASWLLRGEAPARFSIDDDLELLSADKSRSVVRYSRHPLDGKDIRAHLVAGKYPSRLGLTWNDRVSFVLTDKLQVKRLAFLDLGKDDAADVDPAEQFDIDFAVMAGELVNLLQDLATVLGDESPRAGEWPERSKVA